MTTLRYVAKHPTISLVDSSTALNELRQIHAHLTVNGLVNDTQILGQFVASIAIRNPSNLDYSNRIMNNQFETPTLFALNSMIRAYSKTSTPHESLRFYKTVIESFSPDRFTLNFTLRACAHLPARDAGTPLHCAAVKLGLETDAHVHSALISMYAATGCPGSCRRVFGLISSPDAVSRTAMVGALAKCGEVDLAREVFDEMPQRDHIAWNAMIAGYAHGDRPREALELFLSMQADGAKVNEVTMVLVLSSCAQLGALDHGRWAHAYVDRNKLRATVSLETALVEMYSKCGATAEAMEVFRSMTDRNVRTWNAAINGLALNGLGEACLSLFSAMKRENKVEPNEATFLGLLRGCSSAGMVQKGLEIFHSMRETYRIEPRAEHFGCLVDLHGRAGEIGRALQVIETMPMAPHAGAWGALLNACRLHRNFGLAELATRKILELEAESHGAYVQMSNIYAESRDWDSVRDIREAMKSRKVRKVPGCSVVQVEGRVHEFFSGDGFFSRREEIEAMLGEISRRLRAFGYVANTNPVMFDVEEEEKEGCLSRHSERIAIAFGLISLKEGVAIRVVKNLRVCLDCHQVTKMISKIFNREIVVRDRNRFHHFIDGQCSCKDFW